MCHGVRNEGLEPILSDMNAIAWTAVAIRLLSVWLAIGVVIGLPSLLANWLSTADYGDQAGLIAVSLRANVIGDVTTIAVAALLWVQSVSLARFIWRQEPLPGDSKLALTPNDLQRVVFTGVGVYIVAYALPDLAEVADAYYSIPVGFGIEQLNEQMKARAFGHAMQIVVGVALVVGAEGLTNLINRVRARAQREPDVDDEGTDI